MAYTLSAGKILYIQSYWRSVRLTEMYFLGLLVSTLHLGMLMKTQKTPFRRLSMPKMHFPDPVFSDGGSCRNDYYNFFSKERNQELICLQSENIGDLCFVVCLCSVKSVGDGFVLCRNGKSHICFSLCLWSRVCQWQ